MIRRLCLVGFVAAGLAFTLAGCEEAGTPSQPAVQRPGAAAAGAGELVKALKDTDATKRLTAAQDLQKLPGPTLKAHLADIKAARDGEEDADVKGALDKVVTMAEGG